jgi:hypothetical protein
MNKLPHLASIAIALTTLFFLGSCTKQNDVTSSNKPVPTFKQSNLSSSIGNIVDMDISLGDTCYYWTKSGTVSSGDSTNATLFRAPVAYTLPTGKTPNDVVGIGIASNNWCYYWYSDGTVSSGYSNNATAHTSPVSYTLPAGETPTTIVAISIAKNTNNVYTWYKDGTASVGTPTNLSSVRAPYAYTPASGKLIGDIVGIGINGSNSHCFVWYNDGTTKTLSIGITNQLDYYASPVTASF